jgi:hypothetical protein
MTLTDWTIIAGAGAIGYVAVSFFLGRRAPPPQTPQAAPPAAPEPRPAPPSDSEQPAQPARSAWDQMHDRPASEAQKDKR